MRQHEALTTIPQWCEGVQTLFLDLDGCVWFGKELADGASETIARLRAAGKRVAFVTNVSNATRSRIAAKLSALGVPALPEDVHAPIELLPQHEYLAQGSAKVFPLCARSVRESLRELGIEVTDVPELADVVLVGRDTSMTYSDLAAAVQAIDAGARVVALNIDSRVPVDGGKVVPGSGAIVAALREATGADVALIGKPSPFFFETALRAFAAERESTVMVGDTLDSDILGGLQAGLRTVHVGGSRYSRLTPPPVADLEVPSIASLITLFL